MPDFSRRHLLALSVGLGLAGSYGVVRATSALAHGTTNDVAWSFFRGKGLSEAQTAGLLGNFVIESGADPIDPASQQYGGGPGRGIAQWENSRRAELYDLAESRGVSWSDLQLQLDFVWEEFSGPEATAYSELKATSTPADAAVAVRRYYERPKVANDAGRINAAEKIHAQFSGTDSPGETRFPLVENGSDGSTVKVLQHLLRSHDHTVTVDGIFGDKTEAAVRDFQTAKGLGVDGMVGVNSWMSVIRIIRRDARGDAVKALQVALRANGHDTVVDGVFGPATDTTVRSVQRAARLTDDGVVSADVWANIVD